MMKLIFFLTTIFFAAQLNGQSLQNTDEQIDYDGFIELTKSIAIYRDSRLVELDRFLEISKNKNTVILDTRSKKAFDLRHIKGAVHLNFSDFTVDKLAQVIPSKETTILIYCNNNFALSPLVFTGRKSPVAFPGKIAPLALNIPTFINLVGYGYKDIYELSSLVELPSTQLEFEGEFEEIKRYLGKDNAEGN